MWFFFRSKKKKTDRLDKFPKPLKEGDIIEVVSPAGRIRQGELDYAEKWCKKNGWQLKVNKEVFSEYFLGYHYAGDDELRAKQLQQAIDNPEVKAIWFARGGYGSVRIVDKVDFSKLKRNPKYLIGYSDITVFHNHLNNLKIPTIHGVTAKPLKTDVNPNTHNYLAKILKGEFPEYFVKKHKYNEKGQVKGTLVGGNLSMINSLLGSHSFINSRNPILFLEDWYENWYSVDRMLMSLKRAGFLKKIKGLILGSFTGMDEKEINPNYFFSHDPVTYDVIHGNVKDLKIPKLYGLSSGHINYNLPLIMGSEITLKVSEEGGVIRFLK